jgi:signal transduction histidine kinase
MEILALKIIIFIASGISVIMGLYMWFLHNSARNVNGPVYWAGGNLMIGIALASRLIIPFGGITVQALSMLFVTIGLYIYLAGIWSFKEKEIKRWVVIGFPSFDILQTIVFLFIIPINNLRVILHLLVLSVFSILSIFEMFQLDSERRYLKKIFRLNALSFAAFLGILVAGSVFTIVYSRNELNTQYAWIIALGISGGIMTALTFGFLSAVNLHLNKELEEQLKTKSKFFSIITHDLRGPVGTLMAFVDLLNNHKDLEEEQRVKVMENLEVLSQSAFHLLQNLLDWAHTSKDIAQFEEEQIDLGKLIVSNIEFFRSLMLLKSIQLEFKHDENVFIKGNSKMIETIVRNLVSNAIKFTPKEGQITISLRKNEKQVSLTVADTGVGIEPERLDQIFKMGTIRTTNGTNGESGSGLGLAVCKDFVMKNRGTIKVESKVNAGTRFIVGFPLPK